MKTSNTLLLIALLLLVFTLGAYNFGLKEEYASGEYKNPLRDFTLLNFTDFDEIDVKSANLLSVKVDAGDKHEVYLQNTSDERVHVTQDGNRLVIEVAAAGDGRISSSRNAPFHLVIRTPHVKVIRTDATYTSGGKVNTIPNQPQYVYYNGLTVEGLAQDSLVLDVENGSKLTLRKCKLGYLQARAGRSQNSESRLQLMSDNKIQQADIAILNKGHLIMQNLAIPQLSYSLSDSAKIELSGASLAMIRK